MTTRDHEVRAMDPLRRLESALGDRYRLERELGRGRAAIVYLAEDRKHHRRVAIKLLKPELAQAIGADRFLREIEIAARLSHPNILPSTTPALPTACCTTSRRSSRGSRCASNWTARSSSRSKMRLR